MKLLKVGEYFVYLKKIIKMKVKFKRLHKDATFPKRGSELAGGWDVTATEIIKTGLDHVVCKLGFALEIPTGYKLILVPRSNLTNHYWTQLNSPGIFDADFRGECQFRFRGLPIDFDPVKSNFFYQTFPYKEGERIGQVYLEKVIEMEFEEVDELDSTERGDGGFGSTGK